MMLSVFGCLTFTGVAKIVGPAPYGSSTAPDYELPEELTALYGTLLADVALPEGWAWDAEEGTLVGGLGERQHAATFTPEDTDNYEPVSETLTVTVYTNYTFFPAKEPSRQTEPITSLPRITSSRRSSFIPR